LDIEKLEENLKILVPLLFAYTDESSDRLGSLRVDLAE
jgi:hypothetical protein